MSEADSGQDQAVEETGDLRDKLQAMEKRLSKLRATRSQFHDAADRNAEQRNSVQSQYKEHRQKLDAKLEEVREIRNEIKNHKERRNSIQSKNCLAAKGPRGIQSEKVVQ